MEETVEVKVCWGVEYKNVDLFFSYTKSVKTALTLKIVKQVTTQIIGRGQKEGKSGKECQDNFSFLFFFWKSDYPIGINICSSNLS